MADPSARPCSTKHHLWLSLHPSSVLNRLHALLICNLLDVHYRTSQTQCLHHLSFRLSIHSCHHQPLLSVLLPSLLLRGDIPIHLLGRRGLSRWWIVRMIQKRKDCCWSD